MQILQLAQRYDCSRVDFVVDQYPEISIKNFEHFRRAASRPEIIHIHSKQQKTPSQWKRYISDGKNKEAIAEFLFITWKEASFKTIQREITLYITHGGECHCLHVNSGLMNVRPVEDLFCDHEESDTRMFLHALHASQTCNHVIIKSPDTDVAILGVCLSEHFTVNLYFLTGVGNNTRILDLKKVASHLGQSICSSLIGLHIFTGYDSTSAFYGKGKKKHFDLACKHEAFLSAFKDLGTSLDRRESTIKALEKFVCHMYGQYKANDVNDAR